MCNWPGDGAWWVVVLRLDDTHRKRSTCAQGKMHVPDVCAVSGNVHCSSFHGMPAIS